MGPHLWLCSRMPTAHICEFKAPPSSLEQHGCCQDLFPWEGPLGTTVPLNVGKHHQEYLRCCVFPFRGARDVVATDQRLPCPNRGTSCWLLEVGIVVHLNFCRKWFQKARMESRSIWMIFACEDKCNKASAGCLWRAQKSLSVKCFLSVAKEIVEYHLWKCSRPGWTGLWASSYSDRCLCPQQGSWTRWSLKFPSETNHSLILWKPFHMDSLHFHCLKFPQPYCSLGCHSGYFT